MNIQERISRLKKVIPQRWVVHFSHPSNRLSIMKEGLVPKVGIQYYCSQGAPAAVFCTNSLKPKDFFYSEFADDMYLVDTEGLDNEWFEDFNMEGTKHIVTLERIPRSNIYVVFKGSGKQLGESPARTWYASRRLAIQRFLKK